MRKIKCCLSNRCCRRSLPFISKCIKGNCFPPHTPDVIGFAITFGTRTSRTLKKAPFTPRGNPVLSRTALQIEKGALTIKL